MLLVSRSGLTVANKPYFLALRWARPDLEMDTSSLLALTYLASASEARLLKGSPKSKTARFHPLSSNAVLRERVRGRRVKLPLFPQPGLI